MNTITSNKAENVLSKLHKDAKKDMMRMASGGLKSIFRPMRPADFENVYLPISKEQGEDLRQLIIDNDCKNIVEFGTSFGISTIYLAQGAQQTSGKVITTELLESKATKAMQNIEEAELNEYVEMRVGDAMKTLKEYNGPIDLLFLDGWKDLYLPLFQLLEPQLRAGSLIYADNMDMEGTQYYAKYVQEKRNIYSTEVSSDGKSFLSIVL